MSTERRLRRSKEELALEKEAEKERFSLYDKYVLLPFSALYLQNPQAIARKKYWTLRGINDAIGREADAYEGMTADVEGKLKHPTSAFNPVLAEVVYKWFAPENAIVFDPFAGGMTRGSIAARLGLRYFGFDIRKEQCDVNYSLFEKFKQEGDIQPTWICGDSKSGAAHISEIIGERPNFVFTCPPYWNLEKYSTLDADLSNKQTYDEFLTDYKKILKDSVAYLQEGEYACIVLGDIRDEFTGYMMNFDCTTIEYMREFGFELSNRIAATNPAGSAALRAEKYMAYKKVVKVHQDLLVFQRPYTLKTITEMRETMSDEEIAKKLNMAIRQVHRYSRLEGRRLYGK